MGPRWKERVVAKKKHVVPGSTWPVALLTGDWHLSHAAPSCRAERGKEWYDVMDSYLAQVTRKAQYRYQQPAGSNEYFQLPIFVAGDVFDRWNSPPELVNFAIEQMPPNVYAVAGQHDLPNHSPDQIGRSAYWTLVQAKVIAHLNQEIGDDMEVPIPYGKVLSVCGFSWGEEVGSPVRDEDGVLRLAVAHMSCWPTEKEVGGWVIPEDQKFYKVREHFDGFNAAVIGDQHHGAVIENQGPCKYFCLNGTLMRRTRKEIDYKPHVGVLMSDGTIRVEYLDTSKDRFVDADETIAGGSLGFDAEELVGTLRELGDVSLDFFAVVKRWLAENTKVRKLVRSLVAEAMEYAKGEGK